MKRYISHIISLALSVIALIAACAFPIRAQELSIRPLNPSSLPQRTYHRVDTIYAMPGEKKSIKTMDGSDDANTWTYFRWYNYNKGYDKHTDWLERITYTKKGEYTEYTNGFALWTSSSIGGGDDERCYIHYTAPSGEKFNPDNEGIVDIVACDVSILPTTKPTEPRLSGRYLFYIKDARKQYEAILRYKEVWGENNALTNEIIAAHSKYFKEYEEIHAPLGKLGVTLRMQEDLQNYVILNKDNQATGEFQKYCADRVRWTVYQKRGESLERIGFKHKVVKEMRTVDKSGTNETNIIKANFNNTANANESFYVAPHTLYFFDDSETQEDTQAQKELYVTAEVSRGDNGEWYPITLIHLFLEPYSSLTTQSELKLVKEQVDNYVQNETIENALERVLHYYARTPEYIRDNFEVLDSITFDTEDFSIPTLTNNCATGGISPKDPAYLESVSSYLFSYPAQRDKHTSPRYSYALYKSLNMPNVSQPGNGYEDWWMKNGLNNVKLYDRRHEQNPDEYGYFLYVDAAEKPGTLATLRLNNDLCPDTRILVTAWVANMQHTVGDASSCLPADIGLTFFGVTKNGERTQINKYYSGSARRPINKEETEWQQIYFYFNFQEGDLEYDSYLLELNNNTSHSNGADYAIDDIKVYRSKVNFGAEQLTPHCDDEDIRMVVYGEYDNLMFTAARNEVEDTNQDTPDGEVFDIYFRFYNLDGSIIRFDYNNEGEGSNTTFGKMKINTCYDEMTEFDQNNPGNEHEVAYRKTDKAGKRYVVFTTVIPNAMTDGSRPLDPGKTYYVQLQTCPGEDAGGHNHDDENPPAFEWDGTGGKEQFELFRRTNKCKLISPFTIRKSTTIRLDGVMDVEDAGRLCPGRTVQLEGLVQVYDYMNGKWYPDIKILFDWYIKSGNKETDDKIISLLEEFRRKNPGELGEEELKNLLREDEYNPLYEAAFSEEVKYHSLYFERKEIKYTVSDEDESGSIGLFLFPLKPENWKDVILDAEIRDEDIRWCPNPTEATIEIGGPKLVLGFPEVNYPEDYKAGVRIGKGQVTTLTSKNVVKNELYIPINKVLPSIGVDRLAVGKKDEPCATSYAVLVDANSETKIAKVSTFQADRGNGEDYLVLDFTENEQPFSPKEGNQYQVRIFFRDAPSDNQEFICEGAVDFYFRIVPEYLTWTGTGSGIANWNNDNAWERSDRKEDLYFKEQDQDPETDWKNAFAPMKFTYVTVKTDNSPYLYTANADQERGNVLNLTLNKPEKIGDATENIEYDLMVKEADAGKKYGFDCEKYYTNTVKEIYFKPEATLMNQQLLTYEKAHVDFEMVNGEKYWLASPLQGVVAGDMYAPKFNNNLKARQETPAFKPIEFSDEKNDRFNPAFFQRSWDRAVNMYLPGENNRKEYQVVESNWSIEYNDVNVPYSIGKGFYASVEMEGADNDYKALVRLPKLDTSYGYQTPRTKAVNTTISRENNGHLAEGVSHIVSIMGGNDASTPTGAPDGDERHFLVGNPYMTHLDMGRFFNQNSFLTRKYWIVEDGIVKAEISKNGEWTGGESGSTVAPMTAFFVEKADQRGGENILFNTDMMVYSAEIPKTKTRTITAVNPRLSITAERNGKRSRCVITQDDLADNRYDAGEDAVVLLDKQEERFPTVYSIAGNQAAIYNSVKDWKNIPIGIYSDSKEEVTLTFEGMEQLAEPIYLYDALTKESIRLDALNPRVTVPGSTHGRYFLNGTDQQTAENAIAVYSPTPGQLVVAAPAPETLKQIWIYTVAGQLVQAANGLDTSVQTFNLPKGIYMVEATSEQAITKTKVHIR